MPSFRAGHSVISSAAGQLVRGRLLPMRPQGQDAQLGPKGRPGIETSVAASLPSLAGLQQGELGQSSVTHTGTQCPLRAS